MKKENKKEKGLQKFTKEKSKYKYLYDLDYIKSSDLKDLTPDELFEFREEARGYINGIEDFTERHKVMVKYENCFDEKTRRGIWENNHILIVQNMAILLKEYNRMPSCMEIAKKTGLSRTTVHKHLDELETHKYQIQEINNFKALVPNVLTLLYKYSNCGDVSAAKTFLKYVGTPEVQQKSTIVAKYNEPTNFIQINNTVISQEQISSLNDEQIKQLENLLRT